jgi:hypothetical protein
MYVQNVLDRKCLVKDKYIMSDKAKFESRDYKLYILIFPKHFCII